MLAVLLVAAAAVVARPAAREDVGAGGAPRAAQAPTSGAARASGEAAPWFERLERWFSAVVHHVPGTRDGPVNALAAWTADDLDAVLHDVADLASEVARHPVPPGSPIERVTIQSRGRVLPPEMSTPMIRGSGPSGGVNGFLVRAALLHTDVALIGPAGPPTPGRGLLVAVDGQPVGLLRPTTHLYHARDLIDLITPDPSTNATARLWYLTVASWLCSQHRFSDLDSHLYRANRLFSRDADLWLLTACYHETLASPPVQAVIESAPIPRQSISVRGASDELRMARDAFNRALEASPAQLEARIRRARLLALQGGHQEAASELRSAVAATPSTRLLYYALLFLGSEEEALSHPDAALAAYERARTLFPGAQSPYLAISQLARASGDTSAAIHAVENILNLQGPISQPGDPWWTYFVSCGPDADALLAELRRPFQAPPGN